MKNKRHSKLIEIIKHYDITTQDELLQHLRNEGFNVTQATISRDIKELRIIKILSKNGSYKYSVSTEAAPDTSSKFFHLFSDSVTGVDFASNLIVIKCYPGMAQAICAALDMINFDNIVGTIAGDDTILVVSRSEATAKLLTDELSKLISSKF